MAVESLRDLPLVDVLIDDQLTVTDFSPRKFGTGWTITESDEVVEVKINDLFVRHAVTLRIESTVVKEAAELVRQTGVRGGNILLACPSSDFRFTIFCPLEQVFSTQDILSRSQVDFCINIPKFIDEREDNLTEVRTNPVDENLNEPPAEELKEGTQAILTHLTRPNMTNNVTVAEIFEMPFDTLEMSSTPKAHAIRTDMSASERDIKAKKNTENKLGITEPVISISEPRLSNENVQECTGDYHDFQFDISLCVLLDEKIDTAIAASAYLVSEYPYVAQCAEIGLWRRRFKSIFSRFANVPEVFELSQFPISTKEYEKVSDFLDHQKLNVQPAHPVIVIGQEMLDDLTSRDFANLVKNRFDSISIVVVGQSHHSLAARLSGVNHLTEIATKCSLLIGDEPGVDLSSIISNCREVRRFYLPTYLKLALLVAEKKGLVTEKVRELAAQIVPG
jgi:hypothetical protein